MKVHIAHSLGFCFGVRDALAATESVENPRDVTVYGEIVHNERVRERIRARGLREMAESGRSIPETGVVLVTPHGIADSERARLEAAGRKLVDTTCPLVVVAHRAAAALASEGRFVIVVGRRDHVEVRGLVQDLPRHAVVAGPEDARAFPGETRLGVLSQTTTAEAVFRAAVDRLRELNPGADLRVMDTICKPTRDRQEALAELLPRVAVLVVVGGRASRNSRELCAAAEAKGVRAHLVQGGADLDPAWFEGLAEVGLTAGTSTPPDAIDEVRRALESF